jgi:cation:H+ antiporter
MVWVRFLGSAVFIVLAATQLAKYGDIIGLRTGISGMFIGVLLLAGATSLPELLTAANAVREGAPDLTAGDLLGSNTINMLLLAILDMVHVRKRILRNAAMKHALSGSLAIFMIGLVVYFILADVDIMIGWVGLDSLIIIIMYIIGVRLIQGNSPHHAAPGMAEEIPDGTPTLKQGIIGFAIAAGVLFLATPVMVRSSNEIAELTGLGATLVGTAMVAVVTSLPETVTTISAIRFGSEDMAIGNLFGSNMFNMFAMGMADVFYTQGRFLSVIDPSFLLVGMTGLLMTGMGLIGNIAKLEKRILFIELDALALILVYAFSMWLLFNRGI